MGSTLLIIIIAAFVSQCSNTQVAPTRGFVQDNDQAMNQNAQEQGWAPMPKKSQTEVNITNTDSKARGKELYQHHCQKCHGEKGLGDGELATTLKIKPTNLQNLNPNIPPSFFSHKINEGYKSMPKWKEILTQRQIQDLTTYIRSFKQK